MTPPTIDQSVIERLSALLEAATLDRWKHEPIYRGGQLVRNSIVADGREIAYDVNDARDADLIVAMKNALPAILASLSPSPIAGKEGVLAPLDDGMRTAARFAREVVQQYESGRHGLVHNLERLEAFLDQYPARACTACPPLGHPSDTTRCAPCPRHTPPAECVATPGEIQAEAVAGRAQMIAAYRGPVVSFNVDDDRYYLASCDACGWVGSTELCPHDEEDVICPRCFTSGADCGTVAEKIASRPATPGEVGKLCEEPVPSILAIRIARLHSWASEMNRSANSVEGIAGMQDIVTGNRKLATALTQAADLLTQMEAREQAKDARISALEKALERLEVACDTVAGLRTQEMYLAMIDAGQEDALSELGDARQGARALLNPTPTEER
jgi:hypothetical protein